MTGFSEAAPVTTQTHQATRMEPGYDFRLLDRKKEWWWMKIEEDGEWKKGREIARGTTLS